MTCANFSLARLQSLPVSSLLLLLLFLLGILFCLAKGKNKYENNFACAICTCHFQDLCEPVYMIEAAAANKILFRIVVIEVTLELEHFFHRFDFDF